MNAVDVEPAAMTVVFFDLETSGLDTATSEIVEIGAVHESGACFSMLVKPGVLPEASSLPVHGIPASELLQGVSFETACAELTRFFDNLANMATLAGESSDDEEPEPIEQRRPPMPAELIVVAHNGLLLN